MSSRVSLPFLVMVLFLFPSCSSIGIATGTPGTADHHGWVIGSPVDVVERHEHTCPIGPHVWRHRDRTCAEPVDYPCRKHRP